MKRFFWLGLILYATVWGDEPINSNPGAVTTSPGTGFIGEKILGIPRESGMRVGGLWIGDYNYLFTGGVKPHHGGGNSLFQLNLRIDFEKRVGWKGAVFGAEYLQFNGRPINLYAGSIQGYNSLPALPPLDRYELYQIWLEQTLLNDKFKIRIGKSIPSVDFNNLVRAIPLKGEGNLTSTTGLIYTPIFTMPSLLGVLPGYYDSAYGITLNFLPTEHLYFSYGVYDGNLARGIPTGLRGPEFNGYYFQIGEVGGWWKFGDLPGKMGIGGWGQTGQLTTALIKENGIQGVYLFSTQRLWLKNKKDNSGILAYIQYGINNSKTMEMLENYGTGLTFLGLIPGRADDLMGCGMSVAKLNPHRYLRKYEWMFQGYTLNKVFCNVFFLGAVSYIATPGGPVSGPSLLVPPAWTATARILSLF